MRIGVCWLLAGLLSAGLANAAAAEDWSRELVFGSLIGEAREAAVNPRDTLVNLAMDHGVGYVELRAANPRADPWMPEAGRNLTLPTRKIAPAREGAAVVVNRAEMRLYAYTGDDETAWSAPISLGRRGHQTPLGRLPIGQKNANPNWYPTQAHREDNPELPKVVPAGPNNPLGEYALRLGDTAYLLHGTNRPMSIGRQVSRGCIRLYPAHIERLFGAISEGADVRIIDAPVKLALQAGRLYLEVAPSRTQIRAYDTGRAVPSDPYRKIESKLREVVGDDLVSRIDWTAVQRIAKQRRGVPEAITPPLERPVGTVPSISALNG